jgi:glutamate dehydrogenase/leucine dehydrogenase
VLQTVLSHTNQTLQGKKIIVQGAGNVGLNFAQLAHEAGALIVGISDSQVALYHPE